MGPLRAPSLRLLQPLARCFPPHSLFLLESLCCGGSLTAFRPGAFLSPFPELGFGASQLPCSLVSSTVVPLHSPSAVPPTPTPLANDDSPPPRGLTPLSLRPPAAAGWYPGGDGAGRLLLGALRGTPQGAPAHCQQRPRGRRNAGAPRPPAATPRRNNTDPLPLSISQLFHPSELGQEAPALPNLPVFRRGSPPCTPTGGLGFRGKGSVGIEFHAGGNPNAATPKDGGTRLSPSLFPQMKLPLAIMTSDDTHIPTLTLLRQNGYFGLDSSQASASTKHRSSLFSPWCSALPGAL